MRFLRKKKVNSVPPILMWQFRFSNKMQSSPDRLNLGPRLANNKNALTAASSLARLEIRSRNEEAINSTRNIIYSLKVFYFLLYRRGYFLFVSELI